MFSAPDINLHLGLLNFPDRDFITQAVTHLEILFNVWQVDREEADDPEGCAEEDRQGGEKQL